MPKSFKESLGLEALDVALSALGENPTTEHEQDWKGILEAVKIKADRYSKSVSPSTLATPPSADDKKNLELHASIVAALYVLQDAITSHSGLLSSPAPLSHITKALKDVAALNDPFAPQKGFTYAEQCQKLTENKLFAHALFMQAYGTEAPIRVVIEALRQHESRFRSNFATQVKAELTKALNKAPTTLLPTADATIVTMPSDEDFELLQDPRDAAEISLGVRLSAEEEREADSVRPADSARAMATAARQLSGQDRKAQHDLFTQIENFDQKTLKGNPRQPLHNEIKNFERTSLTSPAAQPEKKPSQREQLLQSVRQFNNAKLKPTQASPREFDLEHWFEELGKEHDAQLNQKREVEAALVGHKEQFAPALSAIVNSKAGVNHEANFADTLASISSQSPQAQTTTADTEQSSNPKLKRT